MVQVSLSREADDDEEDIDADQSVVAPYYPSKKMANWWVVIGEPSSRQLLAIKKVTMNKKELNVKLEFTLPKGKHDLKLYVICDSYIGADHDIALGSVDVAEGEDSDEDDDSDEDMEE
jgi:pre-mRNA-splicing helicase BRR2